MNSTFKNTAAFAGELDATDPLKSFRERFFIPQHKGADSVYLSGNSLGLQPKQATVYVNEELNDWARLGVEGHFKPGTGWFGYHELLRESTARLTGALPHEVVVMNHLTVNLHLLLVSFYRPSQTRYKIICEGGAFPSDRYALQSQAIHHGFDPADALVELYPEPGEELISTSKIIEAINDCGNALALVMFGGVHYFTGQVMDFVQITAAAHNVGAYVGFDLAHAIGNIQLELHKWDVDFAVWCSYKYLNGGPGTVGGAYIHESHSADESLPRFAGWWGNDPSKRFTMPHQFVPVHSADSWQLSNAPILEMAALRASLELFNEAGIDRLTAKSKMLTGYLLFVVNELIKEFSQPGILKVITPFDQQQQGCQLSLQLNAMGKSIFEQLTAAGVLCDWREPDQENRGDGVIRVAPVPLYNSFYDVFRFGELLAQAIRHSQSPAEAVHADTRK